ncbi:MAG TPA: molybdopterin molybdotransferase MoeA [Candidatus Azoamicus sp. OHIO1]
MISYFKAISIILDVSRKFFYSRSEDLIDTLNSSNNISLNNIFCNSSVPDFNSAAMDGFALQSKSTVTLNCDNLKKFTVVDYLKAGSFVDFKLLNNNSIIEIMTGARLPDVFDAVVKYEDVKVKHKDVFLSKKIDSGENVRYVGEDYKYGDVIIEKGEVINLSHIMSLSSSGVKLIKVLKKFKIYLICTGDEILDYFSSITLKDNCFIYNSSLPYLENIFRLLGFDVVYLGIVKDNTEAFLSLIDFAVSDSKASLILTTGAVSKGKADFILESLKKIKAKVLFHGVNIKPGKPILFASINSNSYFFGLPGNPISTVIGFRFFVYPFLRSFFGLPFEKSLKATLVNSYFNRGKYEVFLKAVIVLNKNILEVSIIDEQESFKISGLVECNCFVFLKAGNLYTKGDLLDVYAFDNFFFNGFLC